MARWPIQIPPVEDRVKAGTLLAAMHEATGYYDDGDGYLGISKAGSPIINWYRIIDGAWRPTGISKVDLDATFFPITVRPSGDQEPPDPLTSLLTEPPQGE